MTGAQNSGPRGEERHLTDRDLRVERGVEVLRGKLDYWQMVVRSGPSERPDPSTPDDVSNPEEWADYCAWWETVDHESEHRDYVALVAAVEHLLALHAGQEPESLCFWDRDRPSHITECTWEHQAFPLCDDDGIVRGGALHHGTDYACTGHAHFGGFHILCTGPAHTTERNPAERLDIEAPGHPGRSD